MVHLSAKYFRIIQALFCVVLFLVMAVGPGVLKAERISCEYECLIKQVNVKPASCCDKSAAVHRGLHNCDTGQPAHQNSVPDCCAGGPCYGTPLDVRETAAVSSTSIETESLEAVSHLIYSIDLSDQLAAHPAVSHVPSGTKIPIYIRTCVFLI